MMTALLVGADDRPIGSAFFLRRFTVLDGGVAFEFSRTSGDEPKALAVVGIVKDAERTIGAIAPTAAAAKLRMHKAGIVTEAGKRRAVKQAAKRLRRPADEVELKACRQQPARLPRSAVWPSQPSRRRLRAPPVESARRDGSPRGSAFRAVGGAPPGVRRQPASQVGTDKGTDDGKATKAAEKPDRWRRKCPTDDYRAFGKSPERARTRRTISRRCPAPPSVRQLSSCRRQRGRW